MDCRIKKIFDIAVSFSMYTYVYSTGYGKKWKELEKYGNFC